MGWPGCSLRSARSTPIRPHRGEGGRPVLGPSLLKPAALLGRLRPVKLWSLVNELEWFDRWARLFGLMDEHFPGKRQELAWDLDNDWMRLLTEFFGHVEEAGWFEIDWDTLSHLETWWMEVGEEEDCAASSYLSEYLTGIPVKCYGFEKTTFQEEIGDPPVIGDYPALALLRLLLHPEDDCRYYLDEWMDSLVDEEALGWFDQGEGWERLEISAPGLPEPWCWLPEMARFACDLSNNVILDTTIDEQDLQPNRWLWAKDIDFLRQQWAEARPVLAHFEKFVKEIDMNHLGQLLALVVGEESNDDNDFADYPGD